jgi:hypothetical protein
MEVRIEAVAQTDQLQSLKLSQQKKKYKSKLEKLLKNFKGNRISLKGPNTEETNGFNTVKKQRKN